MTPGCIYASLVAAETILLDRVEEVWQGLHFEDHDFSEDVQRRLSNFVPHMTVLTGLGHTGEADQRRLVNCQARSDRRQRVGLSTSGGSST